MRLDEFEAGRFKEHGELGDGAFFAARGHDEHFDIEELGGVRLGTVRDDHFGEEDATGLRGVLGELIAHKAENGVRVPVVPIVDDVLHDVGITVGGDVVEHTAGFERHAIGKAEVGWGGCMGDDFGKIEENAVEMRVAAENLGQQRAVAAADIGEFVEGGKVEEWFEQGAFDGRVVGHAGLEVFERGGVIRDDVKTMAAIGFLHAVFAGLQRVEDVLVAAHVPGVGEEHGDATDGVRNVRAEARGKGRESEALTGVFFEDADTGEHAEDTIEAGGVGVGGLGQGFGGGGFAGGHVIRHAELGDGGDGGGDGLAPQ